MSPDQCENKNNYKIYLASQTCLGNPYFHYCPLSSLWSIHMNALDSPSSHHRNSIQWIIFNLGQVGDGEMSRRMDQLLSLEWNNNSSNQPDSFSLSGPKPHCDPLSSDNHEHNNNINKNQRGTCLSRNSKDSTRSGLKGHDLDLSLRKLAILNCDRRHLFTET